MSCFRHDYSLHFAKYTLNGLYSSVRTYLFYIILTVSLPAAPGMVHAQKPTPEISVDSGGISTRDRWETLPKLLDVVRRMDSTSLYEELHFVPHSIYVDFVVEKNGRLTGVDWHGGDYRNVLIRDSIVNILSRFRAAPPYKNGKPVRYGQALKIQIRVDKKAPGGPVRLHVIEYKYPYRVDVGMPRYAAPDL